MAQSRQTAFKLRIGDINNSKYFKDPGEWEPNYVLFNDKKVSRVNIIANVVFKNENTEGNYSEITLDDGTGVIKVKTWREDTKRLENINVGDFILLVGRVREYNNETYLTPEIAKDIDIQWALVRKLEMEKVYGPFVNIKPIEVKEAQQTNTNYTYDNISEEKIEDVPVEGNRQTILSLVERLDTESGADLLKVIKESNIDEEEANKIIDDLLKEGEIFQIKAGKLKLIN